MNLQELILEAIHSPDYIPLIPAMLLEEIRVATSQEIEEKDFWRALSQLEKKLDVAFTKKGKVSSPADMGIFKGIFSASSRGTFGFVTVDDKEFFIPPGFTKGAIYSDTVAIKRIDMSSKYYGKGNEAEVVSIIERGITTLTGVTTLYGKGDFRIATLTPDNEKIHLKIIIPRNKLNGAQTGDKVLCRITKYPEGQFEDALGEVLLCLGGKDTLEANYKGILHSHGIATVFPDPVLAQAEEVSSEKISTQGRLDLRDKIIFTIDSYEAKDLDDAISIERTENGYILGVHIADVSHYVTQGSPLDKEAITRGTSVYFTDKVVPMLPKALSNGICSLNEGEDRLTLSAFMSLDNSGNILSTELRESVIRSRVKGIYSELNDILEKSTDSEFYKKYESLMVDFSTMLELYNILKKKSEKKGAMELESEEAKIILDEKGHPVDIVKRERGISERLIEQFMLCANEGVATFLHNASIPCVYRVHDEPDKEKIDAFALFARNLGVDTSPLRTKNTVTPSQLSAVLESAKEKGVSSIVSSILLRSLMKARYASIHKSHFGLNTECYCHFTSPIRRYPDLTVHRIVKALLNGQITDKNIGAYEKLASLSAQLSTDNEIRAVSAEREIEDLYMCVYMEDKVGQTLDCIITSVNSFGFFARTENLCQGLVSTESLGHGFVYDRDNHTLGRGKTIYRLGMSVKVKVKSVDVSLRQVNFELVEEKKKGTVIKSLDYPSKKKDRHPKRKRR
ncbi:MAG: ribonuclease R [Clostridia bacterium]|nr:ribonuclease R [Clostridia bacterium]